VSRQLVGFSVPEAPPFDQLIWPCGVVAVGGSALSLTVAVQIVEELTGSEVGLHITEILVERATTVIGSVPALEL
jgi:hypothetical protein